MGLVGISRFSPRFVGPYDYNDEDSLGSEKPPFGDVERSGSNRERSRFVVRQEWRALIAGGSSILFMDLFNNRFFFELLKIVVGYAKVYIVFPLHDATFHRDVRTFRYY